ncbi:UNKNOWN [Stylonychia lemnae]|uniref:Uncharacterized protein n=1 Tax=Stylonychia lemnae TaxID=5949 RepID=A0A078AMD4_STYLE|nr:UNKNOWN [Stylonychia lemnae]|eukprot:CDW83066.1 UNKNOWN [Stylonychia lemnae]
MKSKSKDHHILASSSNQTSNLSSKDSPASIFKVESTNANNNTLYQSSSVREGLSRKPSHNNIKSQLLTNNSQARTLVQNAQNYNVSQTNMAQLPPIPNIKTQSKVLIMHSNLATKNACPNENVNNNNRGLTNSKSGSRFRDKFTASSQATVVDQNKEYINVSTSNKDYMRSASQSQIPSQNIASDKIKSLQNNLFNLLQTEDKDEYDLDSSSLPDLKQSSGTKYQRLIDDKLNKENKKDPLATINTHQTFSQASKFQQSQFNYENQLFGDFNYGNNYTPSKEQIKEIKAKMKRKKRIQFITGKIKEMQKKKTFMTAPDMYVEESEEEVEQPPPPEDLYQPKQDIFDEFNEMIKEVDEAHRVVTQGTDDLAELRKMIRKTKNNINTHITTVDQLKNQLTTINEKSKDVMINKGLNKDSNFGQAKSLRNVKSQKTIQTIDKTKSNGLRNQLQKSEAQLPKVKKLKQITTDDQKFNQGLEQMIFSASNDYDDAREARLQQRPNYESETKIEIMNTLLHINGSMKEFAEDIEERMHKAFRGKAGKKYGLTEAEIELRKIKAQSSGNSGGLGFGKVKDNAKEVEKMAKQYMSSKHGLLNDKFLRKNIA